MEYPQTSVSKPFSSLRTPESDSEGKQKIDRNEAIESLKLIIKNLLHCFAKN